MESVVIHLTLRRWQRLLVMGLIHKRMPMAASNTLSQLNGLQKTSPLRLAHNLEKFVATPKDYTSLKTQAMQVWRLMYQQHGLPIKLVHILSNRFVGRRLLVLLRICLLRNSRYTTLNILHIRTKVSSWIWQISIPIRVPTLQRSTINLHITEANSLIFIRRNLVVMVFINQEYPVK